MNAFLEKHLTRIPMYTLVAGGLGFLLVAAITQSVLGNISYGVVDIIASTAVFTLVSAAASYGLAKLYGLFSHLYSAIITGLILALIFTPSMEFGVLLQYGLIAIIAQASKFVLVYKSRHIFNPAAFGALMGGVLGLQFASWWVGNPALFAAIAIAAFLILFKTRQLVMGGVFLAVSITLITIVGVLSGATIPATIMTALTSWPLLFLVGFMLSEPLTLPPKKWQQLAVATLVGVLVALPFHIGSFYSSPEFALIIGNVAAFILAFRLRSGVSLQLKGRRALTPTTDEFVFTPKKPFSFEAGQYLELTLPHKKVDLRGYRRAFSITSAPHENEVRLGIKFYDPSSSFKKELRRLPLDATLQTTGVHGGFTLPADTKEKLLFIAGGIGITPFISHILASANEGQGRDITLLYFASSPEELAYKDLLQRSNVDVHFFVAERSGGLFLPGKFFTKSILNEWVTRLSDRHAYISGPPLMVSSAKKILRGHAKSIHTDYFSGY